MSNEVKKTNEMKRLEKQYRKDINAIITELAPECSSRTMLARKLGISQSALRQWEFRLNIDFRLQVVSEVEP